MPMPMPMPRLNNPSRSLLVILGMALTLWISSAHAQEFRDGMVALKNNDIKKAVRIWTKLGESGNTVAQSMLGNIYMDGFSTPAKGGVKRDYKQALFWLEKCQELSVCQFDLAKMYDEGHFVQKDPQKAASLYRKVTLYPGREQGSKVNQARVALGLLYQGGALGDENRPKAVDWFLLAANEGNTDAQFWMGQSYSGGRPANNKSHAENLIEAEKWYLLASRDTDYVPNMLSKQVMTRIEKEMTDSEIEQAHRAASAWRPSVSRPKE